MDCRCQSAYLLLVLDRAGIREGRNMAKAKKAKKKVAKKKAAKKKAAKKRMRARPN
jgi:hypothetical protein